MSGKTSDAADRFHFLALGMAGVDFLKPDVVGFRKTPVEIRNDQVFFGGAHKIEIRVVFQIALFNLSPVFVAQLIEQITKHLLFNSTSGHGVLVLRSYK